MFLGFFRWWLKKENQKNLSKPSEKIHRPKIGLSIPKKDSKLLIFAKVWSTAWSRNRVIQISKKNVPKFLNYLKNNDFVNRSNYVMIITNNEQKVKKRQPKKKKKSWYYIQNKCSGQWISLDNSFCQNYPTNLETDQDSNSTVKKSLKY